MSEAQNEPQRLSPQVGADQEPAEFQTTHWSMVLLLQDKIKTADVADRLGMTESAVRFTI